MNSNYRLCKRMKNEKLNIAKPEAELSRSENVEQSGKDNGTLKSFTIEIPGNGYFGYG